MLVPGVLAKDVEGLRAYIAALEKRPLLALAPQPGGPDKAGIAGHFRLPGGIVQEIFTPEHRNSGTAFGFALGLSRALLTPTRPAILIVQLDRETTEMGIPYGPGVAAFGLDADALVLTRTETVAEFLWAIEEASSCPAVAAVIADIAGEHKAIDFTASRRLTLRAQNGGASVFFVRYGNEREASASKYRWKVLPTPSGSPPFDARAPGLPRYAVTLEKGRIAGFSADRSLLIDWTANGFALVESNTDRDKLPAQRAAALSGAEPAALGDRLSQAG
jgi:protein ImuA